MNSTKVKIVMMVIAFGLIVARFIWPNIQVDAITLGLIIVAILPWLTTIVESAKFPGG